MFLKRMLAMFRCIHCLGRAILPLPFFRIRPADYPFRLAVAYKRFRFIRTMYDYSLNYLTEVDLFLAVLGDLKAGRI